MNLDVIVSLGIIIALVELKEWRQSKRVHDISTAIIYLGEELGKIQSMISKISLSLEESGKAIDVQTELLNSVSTDIDELTEISKQSETHGATILREYELNGIPMGYQRRKNTEEFIEGL